MKEFWKGFIICSGIVLMIFAFCVFAYYTEKNTKQSTKIEVTIKK
jgi:hypothetical protein